MAAAPPVTASVEPAPAVEQEREAQPETRPPPPETALDSPPPGLDLEVEAKPVRVGNRWAVDLKLRVHVRGTGTFEIGSTPAIHLWGEVSGPDGPRTLFSDGCSTDLSLEESDFRMDAGAKKTLVRRFGGDPDDLDEFVGGESLTLHVGLCHVGLPDGRWLDIPAATVAVETPSKGRPRVTVTPARAAD